MTTYLGPIIAMDAEGKSFHITIDGVIKKIYTPDQVIKGQPLIDYPGYNIVSEAAHFSPKPVSATDRGAQLYTEDQLNEYIALLKRMGRKHWLLPQALARRVFFETGHLAKDSCLAWWQYCNMRSKIVDMISELRTTTDRDRHRNEKLNASRINASTRIDRLASLEYNDPETEDARSIMERAFSAGAMSNVLREEFEFKILKSGPRKGRLDFHETWVMPVYVACCEAGGYFRRDDKGNSIGVDTVLGGILQHHAFKCGKGSGGSARAKTRMLLKLRENGYRKDNDIQLKQNFPAPIPAVRKHHQQMCKELVRLFRDYSEKQTLLP